LMNIPGCACQFTLTLKWTGGFLLPLFTGLGIKFWGY